MIVDISHFAAMAQVADNAWLQSLSESYRKVILHDRMMIRISQKDERMNRRLARHRAAIWKRRWGRLGGAFLLMCALPLAIFVVAELWGLAGRAVFGG